MFNKNYIVRFVAFISLLSLMIFAINGVINVYAKDNESSNNSNNNDSSIDNLIEGTGKFKFDSFPPGLEKKNEIREPSLNVNPQGKVLITAGEVTEANWPNLKVKIWGLVLSVHVMPDARIIGGTTTTTSTATGTLPLVIPTVAVGDRVDILGNMEKDTGLIHAKTFKNRSQSSKDSENLRQRIADLMRQIDELRAKLKALMR